jgi:hypothetical protein
MRSFLRGLLSAKQDSEEDAHPYVYPVCVCSAASLSLFLLPLFSPLSWCMLFLACVPSNSAFYGYNSMYAPIRWTRLMLSEFVEVNEDDIRPAVKQADIEEGVCVLHVGRNAIRSGCSPCCLRPFCLRPFSASHSRVYHCRVHTLSSAQDRSR